MQADPDDYESVLDASQADQDSQFETCELSNRSKAVLTSSPDYTNEMIRTLMQQLGISQLGELVPFRMLPAEILVDPREKLSPVESRYTDALLQQTLIYYKDVFAERNVSADNSTWTATSDDNLSDKFYYDMYNGFSFLWNNQNDRAFNSFDQAFSQIEHLLRDHHVAFLMYIYDIIIRYEGPRQEAALIRLLDYLANVALTVFKSEDHPIRLIALWMKQADTLRSSLAESTLRRMLQFFQDGIGYFHPETMALLQLFASGMMSRKKYHEAALRYQQLTDAFETMHGKNSYEVCYALRNVSEAYFHEGRYKESLQGLDAALNQSKPLRRMKSERSMSGAVEV